MNICLDCNKEKIQYGAYACGECRRAYLRKWNSANRDKKNAHSRSWVENNKEKRADIVRKSEEKQRHVKRAWFIKYYAKNKDRFLINSRNVSKDKKIALKMRYRARKVNAKHEPYSPKEMYERDFHMCMYCFDKANTLDHVVPLSNGGSDMADNIVAACKSCNSSKGSKTLVEWFLFNKREFARSERVL